MRLGFVCLVALVGCASKLHDATRAEGDAPPPATFEGDASAPDETSTPDADEDVEELEDDAGSGVDALDALPVDDAGEDVEEPPPQDSGVPPADAAAPDGGPCVTSIKAPASPGWTIFVRYPNVSQPYYCPSTPEGNSCKFALISAGATLNASGDYVLTPLPGVCRVDVPAKCLPCTGAVTQW